MTRPSQIKSIVFTYTTDPGRPTMRRVRVFSDGTVETLGKDGVWTSDSSAGAIEALQKTVEFLCHSGFTDKNIVGSIDVFRDGLVRFRHPHELTPTEDDQRKLADTLRSVMSKR